jgi:phage gp29-like protein
MATNLRSDNHLPAAIYSQQARIDQYERYNTGNAYGEMTPQQLTAYLNKLDDGYLEDWIQICNYAQETDADLYSPIQTRIDRVVEAKYQIVPGKSQDPRAQAVAGNAAEFIQDVIDEINDWDASLRSVLQAIPNGVTAHEFQFIRRGGANVIDHLIWRHCRRMKWDDEWLLRLYDYGKRGSGRDGEKLQPDKWVVHVSKTTDGYPSSAGCVRGVIWPWIFRRWVTRYWIHGTEKFGQPHTWAYVPENSKKSTKEEVVEALENLSYDSVAAFEQGTEIVFEGGPGTVSNGEMFQKFMDHAKAQYASHILGAEDITTPGTHGSQSAVETRVEATLDPRTATDAKALATTLRDQMFAPLLRMNLHLFGRVLPPTPKIQHKGLMSDDDKLLPDVKTDQPAEAQPQGTQGDESAEEKIEEQAAAEGVAVSADTALNGAQVTAMLEIVAQVARGELPRETGVELIVSAFPVDKPTAERIMGQVGRGFQPKIVDEQAPAMAASRVPKASPPRRGSQDSTAGQSQMTLDFSRSQNPIREQLLNG